MGIFHSNITVEASIQELQSNNKHKDTTPFFWILIGIIGLFISIKSIHDFVVIKRMEYRYRSQNEHPHAYASVRN